MAPGATLKTSPCRFVQPEKGFERSHWVLSKYMNQMPPEQLFLDLMEVLSHLPGQRSHIGWMGKVC